MDKKSIIGFVLLMLVLVLWPYWNKLFFTPPPTPPPEQAQRETPNIPPSADTSWAAAPQNTQPSTLNLPPPVKPEQPERLIRVENKDFVAIFSTYGGLLKSLELKKITTEDSGKTMIPVQLIGTNVSDPWKASGALTLGREDSLNPCNYLAYECTSGDIKLEENDSPKQLTFVITNPDGSFIRREYTFEPKGYLFKMSLTMNKPAAFGFKDKVTLGWLSPMLPTENDYSEDLGKFAGFYNMGGEVIEQGKIDKGPLRQISTGSSKWVAVRSKYFTNIIIAGQSEGAEAMVIGSKEIIKDKANKPQDWKKFGVALAFDLKGDSFSNDFTIYAGPIDYFRLQKIGFSLGKIVDLGWSPFRPFSIAILWVFVQLYRVLFNYGLVIIAFSVIIKLIFWPLTHKSSRSMYKMKELQPKLSELQAKYKGDPQRLNTETMKLYREFGVNPFSSCLPLLIQMPIFWAIFSVLKNSIELRAADLAFWIHDLSQKDQFYVLPVVMGVSMFIQQKMTITDPKQKMLVYLMPVIFTILFAQWPSGLVLYWTIFNVISIFEQLKVKSIVEAEKKALS